MKKTILLLAIMLSIGINAQTTFDKGNFVNKQNVTVECLIKNYDWASIPKEIEYKINESDEASTMPAAQLNSFYIYGTSHNYKTFDVPIIGIQKGDVFVKSGSQLLKVLVEGKASLLKNNDGIYILALEGETLKPLIYKKYINGDTYEENVAFRLELYNALKCESLELGDFKKLRYTDKQLIAVVNEYNKCQGGESRTFQREEELEISIKAIAGANFYKTNVELDLNVRYYIDEEQYYRESKSVSAQSNAQNNFVAGFEAEVRLPYNHKKWAVFIVPTYNTQNKVSKDIAVDTSFEGVDWLGRPIGTLKIKGNVLLNSISYIEVPIGLRHYFIISENSSLNISAAYGVSINVGAKPNFTFRNKSNITSLYVSQGTQQARGFSLLRIGTAYTFKDRYSVSINYYAGKVLKSNDTNGAVSILLGYKIF